MRNKVRAVSKEDFEQGVRKIGELTIYFKSKDVIYVSDGKANSLFVRWFDHRRGFFSGHWKPFSSYLKTSNRVKTIWDAYRIACAYEIQTLHGSKKCEIPKGIKVYPKVYKRERRKDEEQENNSLH